MIIILTKSNRTKTIPAFNSITFHQSHWWADFIKMFIPLYLYFSAESMIGNTFLVNNNCWIIHRAFYPLYRERNVLQMEWDMVDEDWNAWPWSTCYDLDTNNKVPEYSLLWKIPLTEWHEASKKKNIVIGIIRSRTTRNWSYGDSRSKPSMQRRLPATWEVGGPCSAIVLQSVIALCQ